MDVKTPVRKVRKVKRKISKVKRVEKPDLTMGRIIEERCPENCGCKLATNYRYYWCSSITCDYWREGK